MPSFMKLIDVLIMALSLACSSCAQHEGPPEDVVAMASSFNLSAPVPEMERRVAGGDAGAALSLAYYYTFIENDYKAARRWFKEAARLGGKQEREIYESFLNPK